MTDNPPALDPSLVARVKGILLNPKAEWAIIEREFATVPTLFSRYAMILAAIGPICGLIGSVVFSHGNVIGALVAAVVGYALSLAGVFVLGLVIEALAPTFGGTKDRLSAMKVSVYSATASWVGGVFSLIPVLGILGLILALYGLYILYLGLPTLMKAPQDKALGYTAVVVVIAIVIWWIIFAIVGAVMFSFVGAAALAGMAGT
jgi:hypothetical protein